MEWQIRAIIDIFATKHRSGQLKGLRRYQTALFFLAKKWKKYLWSIINNNIFFLDDEKAKSVILWLVIQNKLRFYGKLTTMIKQEPELQENG